MKKKFFPSVERIGGPYEKGIVVPLASECSYRDPLEVYKRFYGNGPTVFLDSAKFHPKTATHYFICSNPFYQFKFQGGDEPLEVLRHLFSKWRGNRWSELPHFTGGAVGFLSYDLSRFLQPVRIKDHYENDLPKIFLLFVRDLLVFDHQRKTMCMVTNLLPDRDGSFGEAYEGARRRIDEVRRKIQASWHETPNGHLKVKRFRSESSREGFEEMVLKAKAYIRAGDIYQANLSQQFSFVLKSNPLKIYERLRAINPSPFSSFIDFGDIKIISCSPERLIRLRGRNCETRPIAGTKPAGKNLLETKKFSAELLLSEKERAEHLMLLDLERNDLGRVCEYASVRVNEMMVLEKYSHVIHIVSNFVGKLSKEKDRFDLLQAVFPGGTITGCPKIRCMEIIDELEPFRRGLYTGSIGYLDFNGDMDWNIVIRTLMVKGKKGILRVGAGIVHDSIPAKEYEETLHKAEALLEALGVTNGK